MSKEQRGASCPTRAAKLTALAGRSMGGGINGFRGRFTCEPEKSTIMVVVDRFSKFAQFIPLQHPFNAPKVAQVFFEEIFCLYGLPKSIVSDRDRVFLSSFWTEIFKLQVLNSI